MSFPNWVDTKTIRPLESPSPYRAELGIPPAKTVALYAGNIGEKQGYETLAELGENLAEEGSIRLVIAGEGAAAARLSARLAGRGAVHLLPLQPAERLNDLLNLADIHLLPQRADAADLVMPSKLAAMMASGRPVIAGALPTTEVGRWAGGAGILVPPGDSRAMGAALIALAGDESERLRLGARARALACATWDKDKILGDFERRIVALASRPASEH
jgi:putative colanic acid biosynthesis glycosyltransferase WcaI